MQLDVTFDASGKVPGFTITAPGHQLEVTTAVYDCGESAESARCSCGFITSQTETGGCPKCHLVAHVHRFDDLHRELYSFGQAALTDWLRSGQTSPPRRTFPGPFESMLLNNLDRPNG